MKYLIIGMLFFISQVQAADCPPMSVEGNSGWLNSSNPPVSNVTDEFIGDNCEEKYFVTAGKNTGADYSYMLSHLDPSASWFNYSFSIDFANLMESINNNKTIDVFELFVLPTNWVSPNLIDNKILTINIEKKSSSVTIGGDHDWRLNFIWTDLIDSSGNAQVVDSRNITFSSVITEGLLHIDLNWNNHNLKGGSINVSAYSNIFKTDINGSDETVLMTASDGVNVESNLQRVVMTSDFFIKDIGPSLYKIGIINPNSGVSFGDGITLYTPYRE